MAAFRSLFTRLAPRRVLLGSTVGSAALLLSAHSSSRPASMNASNDVLGSMWAAAADGMIGVPGCESLSSADGVMYLAPSADAPPFQWPRIMGKSTVFALTAWNPHGEDAPADYNREANARLQEDLLALKPTPRAVWRSFGFNTKEGWREDGFCVAYATEERVYARKAILKLARKHQQKAVYVYNFERDPNSPSTVGHVVREVLWVGESYGNTDESSREKMAILPTPPPTPLAARDWKQP